MSRRTFSEEQKAAILKELDTAGSVKEVLEKHNIFSSTIARWREQAGKPPKKAASKVKKKGAKKKAVKKAAQKTTKKMASAKLIKAGNDRILPGAESLFVVRELRQSRSPTALADALKENHRLRTLLGNLLIEREMAKGGSA